MMATVKIKATGVCSGGEHVNIEANLDGGPVQTTQFTVTRMTQVLTADDVASTVLPLIQLHARGKTVAQLRADLLAGISVTI